ncbi:MAG: hypothetical protein AUJ60_01015 [Nitrospirae bacterium CG1_02_44_142]|nr:MAG: hypothetical protein AUJ60_01015 [Nitrospirae bacterium CG1_02_44_142]
MKKYSFIFLSLILFGLFILGCATTRGGFLNPGFKDKNLSRVGVVKFSGPDVLSATVTDNFTVELFKLGYFDVFERHQIDKILSEQGFSLTGATEEKARKSLGKLANLDALFVGVVSAYPGAFGTTDINLSVKLIDIETGSLIYACSAKSDHALVMVGTLGEGIDVTISGIINDIRKHFR